ncbi:MAG: FAD-dependent oxidoreductase [Deltaproteobacteria bacterium]|jgi:4-methylaminobutanoate oxidase (formaldehyde-forming)|nr:FAD-dependent oxidoreductase [Deltaproteobacteria bacterium]
MKDQAQIVIIGGGIFGTSVAYHLAKAGCTDVILLEKGELTSGTTFHSVGLVSQFRTSPALMKVMNYTIKLYNELAKGEGGPSLGWQTVGSLRLASSRDRLRALQREVSRANAIGLTADIISPREVMDIFPQLSEDNLYGAVYVPDDGHIDPSGITYEFARQARNMGVQICTNILVTGIELSPTREVSKVITDHGDIKTECIVNAAGQWAPRIGKMVGVHIPIVSMMNQYLTTKPIPGNELPTSTPVIRDPDNLFYCREDVGSFLIGGFETDPKPWSVDGVPWDFSQQLLPSEWELFEGIMEGAMRRIPILKEAGAIELINGPDAFTPDGYYALGPVPGLKGFYVAAGGSDNGIAGGGGVGNLMAEWILEGETSVDTHEMNVRRFGPHLTDKSFLVEQCREVIRYYYHLRYPQDENEWGRPLRTSPFYKRLKDLGAVFGLKNGWERVNFFDPGQTWRRAGADQKDWGWQRPPYFDQIASEVKAAREKVALFDMTSFGKIRLRGSGALGLLQKLAANNLDKPVGRVTYTQFINASGGIESDVTVTRLTEDEFRIISGTAFAANDIGWIQIHLPDDASVEVIDETDSWGCLGLWGPEARQVLTSVSNSNLSNEAFPYMTARSIVVNGATVWAQRVSYVGELGWELYIQPEDCLEVWNALMNSGQRFEIQTAGYKALDALRLEKGYLYWSVDITPEDNPFEAGLSMFVHLAKDDFIGRPALLEIKKRGVNSRLVALTMDAGGNLYGGESVRLNGKNVGRIRSGNYGYTIGKDIGLVYLPLDLATAGTDLEVEVLGEDIKARVVEMPLVDPAGEKIRA